MNAPRLFCSRVLVALSIVVSFTSCEDKALIQKNKDLRLQLSELDRKVDILEVYAGEDPGDQTKALKAANAKLSEALGRLKELDDENERLDAVHLKMEKELSDYKRKYQIK